MQSKQWEVNEVGDPSCVWGTIDGDRSLRLKFCRLYTAHLGDDDDPEEEAGAPPPRFGGYMREMSSGDVARYLDEYVPWKGFARDMPGAETVYFGRGTRMLSGPALG